MWHLTSENDKRIIFVLPEKQVTLGRSLDGQNCNFAIPEDPSISRKHATLLISEGVLFLKDLGSKYGTFVNNSEKVEHNKPTKINGNDIIKFGKMSCVWKVHQMNLTTCTSTLKGENLQNLKNILSKLGGIVKNEWDDFCAYLSMPAITLTIKVVLALVQNSYIVTVDYWNKCLEAVNNNIALPNPDNFIPQILESTLNKENVSFLPNKDRSSIFAGKKVIFFSRRQLDLYKMVLTKSSAEALLLSETKMTKSALCDEGVIVIQYVIVSQSQDTQAQRDQIKDIIEYLKSKGKRVVADAEIGLAILYCSTSKYCNPAFNFSSEVIKQVPCQDNNNQNILAPESQDPSENLCKRENLLIDESLTPTNNHSLPLNNDNSNNTSKRKLSEDSDTTSILPKKQATNNISKLSLSNTKKRQSEFSDLENPSKKVAIANNNDEDDMFNFVKNDTSNKANENSLSKKLNLSKPMKRKHSIDNDEEDLFNFVNKTNKKPAVDKVSHSDSDSVQDSSITHIKISKSLNNIDDKVDVSALRGSKLKELMLINSTTPCYKNIKKEDTTDLDEKLSNLDLGSTSLVVRNDLIVKREAIQVQTPENGVKNFKKFKKVWPAKMQVTLVSSSA